MSCIEVEFGYDVCIFLLEEPVMLKYDRLWYGHSPRITTIVGGVGTILVIIIIACFAIGALLWPYTINTWLIYADKQPVLEWWMGGLMGLVPGLGQSCILAAFITFIIMLFIG